MRINRSFLSCWAGAVRLTGILAYTALLFFSGRFFLDVFRDSPTAAEANAAQFDEHLAELERTRPKGEVLQLVLDPTCIPCEKSFPFYRTLVGTKSSNNFSVEALVEIPPAMAHNYLNGQELSVDRVRQVDFREVGVIGTPTIRVLDGHGKVLQRWTGLLTRAQESEVAYLLGVRSEFLALSRSEVVQSAFQVSSQARSMSVSSDELGALLSGVNAVTVLDVRPRSQYASVHIRGAVNIPLDELPVRAINELDVEDQIVVYCLNDGSCSRDELVSGTSSACLEAVFRLRESGFKNARLIADGLNEIRSAGAVEMDSSERIHLPRIILTENLL